MVPMFETRPEYRVRRSAPKVLDSARHSWAPSPKGLLEAGPEALKLFLEAYNLNCRNLYWVLWGVTNARSRSAEAEYRSRSIRCLGDPLGRASSEIVVSRTSGVECRHCRLYLPAIDSCRQ